MKIILDVKETNAINRLIAEVTGILDSLPHDIPTHLDRDELFNSDEIHMFVSRVAKARDIVINIARIMNGDGLIE